MIKQILKTVLAGILAGIAFFILPLFLLRVFAFFILIGVVFKLLGAKRRGWHHREMHLKFKNMNETERKEFMENFGNRCGSYFKHSKTNNPVNA